jgi:sporulation protein YqfC
VSERRELRQKVASFLELPGDVMMDVARISLVGDMELLIENHRGIVEYKPERVALAVPNGQVAIAGTDLAIATISPDQVLIRGRIRSIAYQ